MNPQRSNIDPQYEKDNERHSHSQFDSLSESTTLDLDFTELCDIWEHADLLFSNENFYTAHNLYHDCARQTSNLLLKSVLLTNAGIAALHAGLIGQAQQLWLAASTYSDDQVLPHYLHGVTAFHRQAFEEARLAFRNCRKRFKPGRIVIRHRDMGLDYDLELDHVLENEQIAGHELFQRIMGRSNEDNSIDLPHDFPGDLVFHPPARSPSTTDLMNKLDSQKSRSRQSIQIQRRLSPPRSASDANIQPTTGEVNCVSPAPATSERPHLRSGHGRSSSALPCLSKLRTDLPSKDDPAVPNPLKHFLQRQVSRIRSRPSLATSAIHPAQAHAVVKPDVAENTRRRGPPPRPPRPDEHNTVLNKLKSSHGSEIGPASPTAPSSWSILDLYIDREEADEFRGSPRVSDSRIRRWQSTLPDPLELGMEQHPPVQGEMVQVRPFQNVFVGNRDEVTLQRGAKQSVVEGGEF